MPARDDNAYYCLEHYIRWADEADIDDGNLFPCKPRECIADRISGPSRWQPTKHVSGVELGSRSNAMKFSRPADHQRGNGRSMRPRYRRTPASVLVNRHILEHRVRNIQAAIDESKPSRHTCLGTGVFTEPVGLGGELTGDANSAAAVGG